MTGIKDVAREVEMSTATVSRALRGLPGVSDATRERVQQAARQLGYVPSPSAAGLASGQTRTVAVVVPFVTRWFFASVVQGAEEVLRERGYDLLLYNLAGSAAARHRVFEGSLLTKRVDAVLVLSLQPSADELTRLAALGPAGHLRRRRRAGLGHGPHRRRVRRADRHRAPDRAGPPADRLRRRSRACSTSPLPTPGRRATAPRWPSAGLPHDPSLEVDGEFTLAGGTDAGRQLLVRPDRPTAIFAASDEMAIGVLRAARELHLRVPEDVSVIGIDDHELAAFFDLTTVAQPVHEQGRVAARQVLDALAASTTEAGWHPEQVILPTTLLQRGSTGPPPPS